MIWNEFSNSNVNRFPVWWMLKSWCKHSVVILFPKILIHSHSSTVTAKRDLCLAVLCKAASETAASVNREVKWYPESILSCPWETQHTQVKQILYSNPFLHSSLLPQVSIFLFCFSNAFSFIISSSPLILMIKDELTCFNFGNHY